jgi:hypothetical protein
MLCAMTLWKFQYFLCKYLGQILRTHSQEKYQLNGVGHNAADVIGFSCMHLAEYAVHLRVRFQYCYLHPSLLFQHSTNLQYLVLECT